MGTGHGIEWYSVEQVLSGFDGHAKARDTVYYSIWQGKSLRFGFNDGDINEGRDILAENLQPLQINGNTATYTIKFHPGPDASGYITDKTPVMGSFNFKVTEPFYKIAGPGNMPPPAPAAQPAQDDKLNKILDLLMAQDQRIKELEEAEPDIIYQDEEEEEEPDTYSKAIGQVQNVERLINESPLLNDLYTHLRLGVKVLAKRFGVEPENEYKNNYNIAGMSQQPTPGTEQAPGQQKTFTQIFGELVEQFPELPNMLGKLHHVMCTDPDMFRVVKKKLIDGVNNI